LNLIYYTFSVIDLCRTGGENWVTKSIETHEEANPLLKDFKVLFFDIDDTLNAHGLGLDESCCETLNNYAKSHFVVLLTNCSQKRAQEHGANLMRYQCNAELWPVGRKPNYKWLLTRVLERGWEPRQCAMYGDRPTMDLWCAYRAGFGARFWVQAWARKNKSKSMMDAIKRWEWRQMQSPQVNP